MNRESANSIAGVPVPPSGDEEVESVTDAIKRSQGNVVVPLFNVVDDSNTTQESMANVVGEVYGIKVGFYGNIISTISGLRMKDVVEVSARNYQCALPSLKRMNQDINEMHMEQWAKIITTSSPPVPNTPLSPYAHPYILEEHGYAIDGDKIKRVRMVHRLGSITDRYLKILGFTLMRPQFEESSVREFIDWCRQEGIWPECPELYSPLISS
jgi:hypothetical protein